MVDGRVSGKESFARHTGSTATLRLLPSILPSPGTPS